MKRYILIPYLANYYSERACPQKIAEAIISKIRRQDYIVYTTIEDANINSTSTSGIIELEVDNEDEVKKDNILNFCKDILALPSDEEREKRCSALMKTVYVKGFHLPFSELEMKKREASQIASFNFNSDDDSKLQLIEPPLLYLKKIPKELLFLLFTDHQFFINFENWRHYNARESRGKGCIYDLFHATTYVCDLLTRFSKNEAIKLDDIKKLHELLSNSVFANFKGDERQGIFRKGYNSFPLNPDAVTVEGIKELLQRIKTDNQVNGFRIGYHKESNIVSIFCAHMSQIIRKEQPWKEYEGDEFRSDMLKQLEELEKKAIEATYKKTGIPKEEVGAIVNEFLKDFKPHEQVATSDFFGNLLYYYSDLSATFSRNATKAELQFDLKYSREHALASSGDVVTSAVNIKSYEDIEIEALAKTIYIKIQSGEKISLFTPEVNLAEKWANEALEKYNDSITETKSVSETIRIIDDLVHELEILHLFNDVNCRTNDLLKNLLFLAHLIKWSTEFNPNRLDAYSSKERVLQHKQGIFRTDYIIMNQDQLIKNNIRIDLIYLANKIGLHTVCYSSEQLNEVNVDNQYQEVSQQLVEKLEQFEQTFKSTLDSIIKKYDLQSSSYSSNTIFTIPGGYNEFSNALKQFQSNYNACHFFKSVEHLNTIPEIGEDIKSLKALTGFNNNWALSESYQADNTLSG